MKRKTLRKILFLLLFILICINSGFSQQPKLGDFDTQGDMGGPDIPGSCLFDATEQTYLLAAAGRPFNEQFHYLSKKNQR